MRVVCHAQHLTGVGHFVRMHTIAASLSARHDVYLVDGGRPFPRPILDAEPARIELPVLRRDEHGALVGDEGEAASTVLARGSALLAGAVEAIRPDVVLVDHYPFSKWELADEIRGATVAARHVDPDARVVCSLRDIVPRTRYEAVSDAEYGNQVLERLAPFDAILVHADPRLSTLPEHFPAADRITVPVRYTGVVVEPLAGGDDDLPSGPFAVASAGGLDATEFLGVVADAFGALVTSAAIAEMPLHVFAPAHASRTDLAMLQSRAREQIVVHEFSGEFGSWLDAAALSISRGGYNTVAALLRSRVPAVVVPDSSVSDQRPRAAALARAELAAVVNGGAAVPSPAALQKAILRALERGRPDAGFDLDGAATTRDLLERLVAGEEPWAPERAP